MTGGVPDISEMGQRIYRARKGCRLNEGKEIWGGDKCGCVLSSRTKWATLCDTEQPNLVTAGHKPEAPSTGRAGTPKTNECPVPHFIFFS